MIRELALLGNRGSSGPQRCVPAAVLAVAGKRVLFSAHAVIGPPFASLPSLFKRDGDKVNTDHDALAAPTTSLCLWT